MLHGVKNVRTWHQIQEDRNIKFQDKNDNAVRWNIILK